MRRCFARGISVSEAGIDVSPRRVGTACEGDIRALTTSVAALLDVGIEDRENVL